MSSDIETYLELLDKRLSLLRLLAREFVDCRKEFMAFDLDGMYRRISEQEELCRQIQRLHPAIQSLQQSCAVRLGIESRSPVGKTEKAAWTQRLGNLMNELGAAQAEVWRLNQVHAAYLRRSRRTVEVLMNFIGSYAMTYQRPAEPISPAMPAGEKG